MESAHLTRAHEHVRNAATATYGHSIATAGSEHEKAAAAFHDAAQDTNNDEALRILGLLENHHHKLAGLIKEAPRKKDKTHDASPQALEASADSPPSNAAPNRTTSPPPSTSSPTRAPSRRRLPQSSIASNLAEKRGIPGARRGTPTASSVSVTNALAARNERQSTPVRDLLQQQSRKAEEASRQKEEHATKHAEAAIPRDASSPPDDNFRRFKSAFGGVISAISAPLAFTSLPLNPATPSKELEPAPPSPTKQKSKPKPDSPEASRTVKSSEPDLRTLISKPALRALREDQSAPLGPFANNESFYFVPTSGGTVSYANILRDPQAHPHHAAQDPHLDSIPEGADNEGGLRGSSHEEFVDARESIGPPSPTTSRRPRSKGSTTSSATPAANIRAGRGNGSKTMEELQLENETMRGLIDKQAKRLSMWETTSQSSYNALAQSFRARSGVKQQLSDPSALAHALAMGSNAVPLPSPPPVPSIPPQYKDHQSKDEPDPDREKDRQRLAELEALIASQTSQLQAITAEKEQLSRQTEKQGQVIGRYREQWEKLKAGARKKEQERREKRLAEIKAGEQTKDSESGENEPEEAIEDEAGFGKA